MVFPKPTLDIDLWTERNVRFNDKQRRYIAHTQYDDNHIVIK